MSTSIASNAFKTLPDGTYFVQGGEVYETTYKPYKATPSSRGIDRRIYSDSCTFILTIDTDEIDGTMYYSEPCIDVPLDEFFDGRWECTECRMGSTLNIGEAAFSSYDYDYRTCSSCGEEDIPCMFIAEAE